MIKGRLKQLMLYTLLFASMSVFADETLLSNKHWEAAGDIDGQLSHYSMVGNKSGIFVLGGKLKGPENRKIAASDNVLLNDGNQAWQKKARMLTPRHSFSSSVINERIFLVGGANFDDEPIPFIDAYDPDSDQWQRVDTLLPTPRYGLSSVSYRGKVYTFGGITHDSSGQKKVSSLLEIYEPNKNEWFRKKAEMPTPRYGLAVVEHKGKFYAIGGISSLGAEAEGKQNVTGKLEVYDPIKDVWHTKAEMLTPRAWISALVMDERIYVFGGVSKDQSLLQSVESYDLKSDKWSIEILPTLPHSASAAIDNKKTLVVTGLGCHQSCITALKTTFPIDQASNPGINSYKIDDYFAKLWKDNNLIPAALSTDYEFQRRVTLDIVGRIPSKKEISDFKKDNNREKLIDALLKSQDFSNYWSEVIAAKIFGTSYVGLGHEKNAIAAFVRQELEHGHSYKSIVGNILTADPKPHLGANQKDPGVFTGYYAAQLRNPKRIEDLVNNVGRAFMGTQLHCAQCHDSHIDKRTSQSDYYGLVAFFSGFSVVDGKLIDTSKVQFQPEKYSKTLSPRFINGEVPKDGESYRHAFARLMTDSDDFSLAFVNDLWAKFFGVPLETPSNTIGVIPESELNPLLKELASQARAENFDLRKVIKKIATSRVYQLTSRQKDDKNTGNFYTAQFVRPMSPIQAFNSISTATKLQNAYLKSSLPSDSIFVTQYANGYEFVKQLFIEDMVKTADYESPNAHYEYTANISQVLKFMDIDSYIYAGIKYKNNGRLDEILKENTSVESVVKAIYLNTLSRDASKKEVVSAVEFLKKQKDIVRGYEQLFWALLNTSEFFFNH